MYLLLYIQPMGIEERGTGKTWQSHSFAFVSLYSHRWQLENSNCEGNQPYTVHSHENPDRKSKKYHLYWRPRLDLYAEHLAFLLKYLSIICSLAFNLTSCDKKYRAKKNTQTVLPNNSSENKRWIICMIAWYLAYESINTRVRRRS